MGTSNSAEYGPTVAADITGDFVVAYYVSSTEFVYSQRFSGAGSPQGSRQLLTPPDLTIGDEFRYPKVGRAFDGSFVVAYVVYPFSGSAGHSHWHLFNEDGSQRSEGSLATNKFVTSVDMDSFGNFVIGYTHFLPGVDYQAEATFFDSSGKEGETVALNQNAAGLQGAPSVAIENNLLAASYSDTSRNGDVEFSVIEQRRGKLGVARPNEGGGLTFFLDSNANLGYDAHDSSFDFGLAGDIVVVGDWNGDGDDDLGVGRPNQFGGLTFFLDSNGNRGFDAADAVFNFGLAGDIVVVGDWNGDGVDNLGVARHNGFGGLVFSLDANGSWYFDAGDATFQFGLLGDIIVVGDWDGDGTDNLGVARANGSGGLVFSLDSNGSRYFEAGQDAVFNYGLEGDGIVTGDWDGDDFDALGVVRANGTGGLSIFLDQNENYQFDLTDALFSFNYGLPGDLLVVGSWEQTALRSS